MLGASCAALLLVLAFVLQPRPPQAEAPPARLGPGVCVLDGGHELAHLHRWRGVLRR
jgi:hypothetical protein